MSAAAMAGHATTLAAWDSSFEFAGPAGLMPDDPLQLTLFVTALGSGCPGGPQCAMLFDPILSADSVGLVFTLDSTAVDFGQAVALIEADDTLLEYFPNGTGLGKSADQDFHVALPAPLFSGDTITDLELTIVSCSFQINNSFTGAGARIFGFDLTVNGTGPVPAALTAEPASWLILGSGMAFLLLFTARIRRVCLDLFNLACVALAVQAQHKKPLVAVEVSEGRVRHEITSQIGFGIGHKFRRARPRLLEFRE